MNYYELLNIKRGADETEIKRAYFSAVKLHSPDFDPEGFKAIRAAYETLSNEKKRSEYDSYFTVSGDLQNEILAAHNLIRESKYRQAVEFISELCEKNPDSSDAKRLLAEALYKMRKTAPAGRICAELLKKNPDDSETLLLLAQITVARGYKNKAADIYKKAAIASPKNPKMWIEYMHYALSHNQLLIPEIFRRAMKQDIDIFRNDYLLYMAGLCRIKYQKNHLRYYNKFAEYYVNDINPEKNIYENLIRGLPAILSNEELIPFLEKILPTLEKSRQRIAEDDEKFEFAHSLIMAYKTKNDKRIHEVLFDMSMLLLTGENNDEDKNELLAMECYIVFDMLTLRPSIKVLKNEYPQLFKLNQAFYIDVLNEKKNDYLLDKYKAMHKKLKPTDKNTNIEEEDQFYFDFNEKKEEEVVVKTFIRESPKVGRNDPCPCGSGKKYKKCCGRG